MGNCIASQTYNNDDSTPSSRAEISGSLDRLECYSFEEIHAATKGYKKELRLGQGFLGEIYEGWIGQNPVAVKAFQANDSLTLEEITSEIKFIASLRHKNLSKTLGFCVDSDRIYLIYEFVTMGSLENLLFSDPEPNISFKERLKIALSVATALAFLHSNGVIHGNIKTSNILLNMNYKVKLTEFGLYHISDLQAYSKDVKRKSSLNFCDPLFLKTEKMIKSCDVYSFGIVMLHLLTGKNDKSVSSKSLCDWALPIIRKKSNVLSIVDPSIKSQLSSKTAQSLALRIGKLAAMCVHTKVHKRPSFDGIIRTLNTILNQFHDVDQN